jgi:hypothetical protein
VTDEPVFNDGADEKGSLARLKFLLSGAGLSEEPAEGYDPIDINGDVVSLAGKKIKIGASGLVENVESFYTPENRPSNKPENSLFYKPIRFSAGKEVFKAGKIALETAGKTASVGAEGKSANLKIETSAKVFYEGVFDYTVRITAVRDVILPSVGLSMFFSAAEFFAGFGYPGGKLEGAGSGERGAGEDIYIGDVNCGALIKLNSGFETSAFEKTEEGAVLSASAGRTILSAGTSAEYSFEMALTPFKAVDYKKYFNSKTFVRQPEYGEKFLKELGGIGAPFLALPAGNKENADLNYPFGENPSFKLFLKAAREADKKVLFEYSAGGLSDKAEEKAAFEDLKVFEDIPALTNYFLGAAALIFDKFGIDGLTVGEPEFGRSGAERLKKIISEKTGDGIFELKTDFPGKYTGILPFADRAVPIAGDVSPEEFLVRYSGVPFGLTAAPDVSQAFPALLFGETGYEGRSSELYVAVNRAIAEIFKKFGLGDSQFCGFWNKQNPIGPDKREIYVSSYIKGEEMLAVVYNSSPKAVVFDLGINPKLGFSSKGKKLFRPGILGMQSARTVNFNKPFKLKGKKGMVIIIRE